MKVALFGKVYAENQRDYLQLLIDELAKRNSKICIYEPYYKAIAGEVNFSQEISLFNTNRDIVIKHLKLDNSMTTEDGLFTFELVECLGQCHTSPAMNHPDEVCAN